MTRKQAARLREVRKAAPFARACIEHRNDAIRKAVEAGVSLRDVAEAAELGHTTVARITKTAADHA